MRNVDAPTSVALEKELKRERYKRLYRRTLISTFFVLVTAAAVAVLVAMLWMPVLQIYGTSMSPTLQEGQVVAAVKTEKLQQGDLVVFYYGNKLLVKRCIAGPGSWVDIQPDGTILVDGVVLEEPYIQEKSFGNCDLTLPYQVPANAYFLVGDQRATSVDSRSSVVGCVSTDDIVGKLVFRLWPLGDMGTIG